MLPRITSALRRAVSPIAESKVRVALESEPNDFSRNPSHQQGKQAPKETPPSPEAPAAPESAEASPNSGEPSPTKAPLLSSSLTHLFAIFQKQREAFLNRSGKKRYCDSDEEQQANPFPKGAVVDRKAE